MKQLSSHIYESMTDMKKVSSMPYQKLLNLRAGGRNMVVSIDGNLYPITGFYDNGTFTINPNKRNIQLAESTYYIAFLHKGSAKGWFEQSGLIVPIFAYKPEKIRTDVPTKLRQSADKVMSIGQHKSNLVGHIVQSGNTDKGGFVVVDDGSDVVVRMKNGKFEKFKKNNLQKVENRKDKIWFRFNKNWDAFANFSKEKSETKESYFADYMELQKQFDPDYERSDDYRVGKRMREIKRKMDELWKKLSSDEKKKTKLI